MQDDGRRQEEVLTFRELPPATRVWLENLRPKDIEEMEEALKFFRNSKTLGRFWKWLVLSMVGIFVASATFGDQVIRIWRFFHDK